MLGDAAEKAGRVARTRQIGAAIHPLQYTGFGQRLDGTANSFFRDIQRFRQLCTARRPAQAVQRLEQFKFAMGMFCGFFHM